MAGVGVGAARACGRSWALRCAHLFLVAAGAWFLVLGVAPAGAVTCNDTVTLGGVNSQASGTVIAQCDTVLVNAAQNVSDRTSAAQQGGEPFNYWGGLFTISSGDAINIAFSQSDPNHAIGVEPSAYTQQDEYLCVSNNTTHAVVRTNATGSVGGCVGQAVYRFRTNSYEPWTSSQTYTITLVQFLTVTGTSEVLQLWTCSYANGDAALNATSCPTRTSYRMTMNFTPPGPVLGVSMTHGGNGVQGGSLAYTVTPSASGAATTGATLTAAFTLPSGMTYSSASGTGWTCSGSGQSGSCTSTAIFGPGNGAAITLNVAIAGSAGSPLAPGVTLSGGGAIASASATDSTTITAPAVSISSVSPAVGATVSPASVVIAGTNFSASGNSVTFGGAAGTVTGEGVGAITVTPPNHAAGAVDVVVTNAGGQSATATNGYTYVAPPTLSAAFSPTAIRTDGSATLTLTLTNPNAGTTLTGASIGASALPPLLVGSGPSTTCSAATVSLSGSTFSLSGASLAGGASCTVTLTVASTTPGSYSQVIGAPAATGPIALTGSAAATPVSLVVSQAPPVATGFTASAVAYNPGGAGATAIDVSGNATNSPTGYAVGSATTAQGGTVSITDAGLASYTPRAGFRGNDSFTFTASNGGGGSGAATVVVPVGDPTLSIGITNAAAVENSALPGTALTISGGLAPYSCSLASGALPPGVSLAANCALSGTPTAAGTYGFTVRVEDSSIGAGGAANPYAATSNTLSIVVSSAVPVVSSVSPAVGHVNDPRTVTITGSNFTNVTAVRFGAIAATGYSVNSSTSITASAPAGTAGAVNVTVTANGQTSATGAGSVYTYFGDPVISAPANGSSGASAQPVISGTGAPGAAIEITITGTGGGSFATVADGSGNWSYTPAALGDGAHSISATQTLGGSTSGASNSVAITIDTTAPAVPLVTSPVAGATIGASTVEIAGTAEAGATVTVSIDGGVAGTATAAGDGRWSYSATGLAEGAHSVQATAADALGNVSAPSVAVAFRVDLTAPAAPVITAPAAGSTLTTTTPVIAGTAEADSQVTISIDGTPAGTVTATGGAWTFTAPALAQGTHSVAAQSADSAGNVSAPSTNVSFSIDSTAPAAPVIATPAANAVLTSATPGFAGSAEAGATVTVSVDGNAVGTATADGGGAWSLVSTPLADGAHSVTAVAVDGVGNGSSQSTPIAFTIDTTAPAAPAITAPAAGAALAVATPGFEGTAEAGSQVTVLVDGIVIGTTAATGGAWTLASPALADGTHSVTATATDAAGHVSPASAAVTFIIDTAAPAAPTVTAPAANAVLTTDTAVVSGSAEAGSTVRVSIDGTPVGTATATGGSWSFTTPPLAQGGHSVTATAADAAGNVSSASIAVAFTIDSAAPAAPVFTAPAADGVTGTTPVFTGTAEAGATVTVQIDGTVAGTTVATGGSWSIAASAPLAPGSHSAQAVARDGAGNASPVATLAFSVAAAPVIAGISPDAGPSAAGTRVTLSGSGLANATAVTFGAAPGSIVSSSASELVVTAPAGSGSVTVTVTTPGGAATVGYRYHAGPTLAAVTPAAGPVTGGNSVTLTGTGLAAATQVLFGASPAAITATSDTELTVTVPAAGAAASVPVTVRTPGGVTASMPYAYSAAPVATDRDGVTTAYNTAVQIDLSGSITGPHDSIAILSAPGHGIATVAGDVVTYLPVDHAGADSFTYAASGAGGTSAPATVTISVAAPPPPAAQPTSGSVAGSGSVGENASLSIDLSELITGEYDTVVVVQEPSHGTVEILASNTAQAARVEAGVQRQQAVRRFVAVYTPNPGYTGPDSFAFAAEGPGGRSAPALVTIEVIGSAPVALAKTAQTGDNQTVSVNLTEGATGGPFTDAAVVGVTPADSAITAIVRGGTADAPTYRLDVTPQPRFGGTIVVRYTLSNAIGTSAPAEVTVTVTARPDPTSDPNVRAISDAQAETARRFARSQTRNFMRRAETLHGGGGGQGPQMGITLTSGDPALGTPIRTPAADNAAALLNQGDTGTIGPNGGVRMRRWAALGGGGETAALARGGAAVVRGGGRSANSPARGADAVEPGSDAGDGGRPIGSVAVWTGGSVEIGTRDRVTGREKISATTSGLSAGADLRIAEGATIGIGGGYGADRSRIGGGVAQVRADNGVVAAYGSFAPVEDLFIDALLGVGDLSYRTRRETEGGVARGNRDGGMTFAAISAGIDRRSDALNWSLYGRGEWLEASLHGYAETEAGRWNLRFDSRDVTSLTGVLGGRIDFTRRLGIGIVTPRLRAEWQHEFNGSSVQRLDYADVPGVAFYGIGTEGWRRDQFEVSVGSRLLLPRAWSVDFELGLRAASGERAGSVAVEIAKEF